MLSAAHFIDFFVHDMLDYTLLNKKNKNFTKDFSIFSIQDAAKEVIGFHEDKA